MNQVKLKPTLTDEQAIEMLRRHRPKCPEYDYRKVRGYWPDINEEEVRQLYLHKAMKLIDRGVDVIWIDQLLKQARLIYSITGNIKHPAIGLYMSQWEENEAKILSWREVCWVNVFGEERCGFPVYDSLAPEFQTYETIRELAQSRRGERRE